jgi:hypothetical protein
MKYSIRPYICCADKALPNFLQEIHGLSISELNDVIDSLFAVMNGMHDELYWKKNIPGLHMRKEITQLSYRDILVKEMSTVELYNMLKAYSNKVLEYETRL